MILPIRPRASTGAIQALVDRVVPAYEARLNERGYSPNAFSELTRTARHMLAWLTLCEKDVAVLDIRGVASFLSHACDCPVDFGSHRHASFRWQAQAFLGYLIETGQTAVPSAIETGGRLVDEFSDSLAAQGYRASTMRTYLPCCRHFIVWLYLTGLDLVEVDGSALRRFLDHDCACAHPGFLSRPRPFSASRYTAAKLEAFADFLVKRGVATDWREPESNVHRSEHAEAFLDWLRQHRGVRPKTLASYSHALRTVLALLGEHPASYVGWLWIRRQLEVRQAQLLARRQHYGVVQHRRKSRRQPSSSRLRPAVPAAAGAPAPARPGLPVPNLGRQIHVLALRRSASSCSQRRRLNSKYCQ